MRRRTTSSNHFCLLWDVHDVPSSSAVFFLLLLLVSSPLSLSSVVVTASSSSSAYCPDHPDLVTTLPGYPLTEPPNCWYSGYLTYKFEKQSISTHYIYMTAELDFDANNKTKPLIYWTNGGPGASSLFGLLTELGPLLFNDESLETDEYRSTGVPTPLYNPYAWSRIGHILVFDQSAPIGFSYCNDNVTSHSCGGIVWNDELTSKNAFMALQTFFHDKFPNLANKDLYLTGESYGGIYIPTLAREILHYNDKQKDATKIPLKGFAVGDGCLGTETGVCRGIFNADDHFFPFYKLFFLVGHGQIPMKTFKQVMDICRPRHAAEGAEDDQVDSKDNHHDDDEDMNMEEWFLRGGGSMFMNENNGKKVSDMCNEALKKVQEQVGGVYAYGLYDECTYSNGMMLGGAVNDYPCGGDIVMTQYLNMDVVREALHVHSDFFSVDNAEGDFDYIPTEKDLTGFYKEVNQRGLKVLIYNGDSDPAINSFEAQNWTSSLHFAETEPWRPWTVDGCRRMGGYVTRYENNFDFLTIRGAGHMVPTNKAAAAFTFLKAWIEGTDYPVYDKDCESPPIVGKRRSFQHEHSHNVVE